MKSEKNGLVGDKQTATLREGTIEDTFRASLKRTAQSRNGDSD